MFGKLAGVVLVSLRDGVAPFRKCKPTRSGYSDIQASSDDREVGEEDVPVGLAFCLLLAPEAHDHNGHKTQEQEQAKKQGHRTRVDAGKQRKHPENLECPDPAFDQPWERKMQSAEHCKFLGGRPELVVCTRGENQREKAPGDEQAVTVEMSKAVQGRHLASAHAGRSGGVA
jgi:hypothetical protein